MCLPKTQSNLEQRKLYEMKSAVNKKPLELKTRPECNDDAQVDALLESIENLDKILANIGSG
jgi:histone acetyltransferase (RNA polymerase elongator complex component)